MSSRATILLVDDNAAIGRALRIACEVAGHSFDMAATPEEALSHLASRRVDVILLDLNFTPGRTAGEEGLGLLRRIVADDPAACVIVITAHSGIRVAVAAMQAGACDFVMKPWRNSELLAKIGATVAQRRRSRPDGPSMSDAPAEPALLLGDSRPIAHIRDLVRRLGPTAAGIAVTGPSGSGRTLVTRSLHAASAAATQVPVIVDARDPAQWSRLDDATGTLILRHADRLDDLEQARLLDRLPSAVRPIAIAETLRSLGPPLRARIATIEIGLPPLAAREGDALLLARHFLRKAAERHALPLPTLTPAAERVILDTVWQDEVRGLALAIERAVLLGTVGTIDAAALAPAPAATVRPVAAPAFDLADNEKAVIVSALREHHHNVSQAAAALGLSRGALYRRMERYGL